MKGEITNMLNKFFNSLVFVNRMIQILCPFVKCVVGTVTGEYFNELVYRVWAKVVEIFQKFGLFMYLL